MNQRKYLFRDGELSFALDDQQKKLREKIHSFGADYLFSVDETQLIESLVDQHGLNSPVLKVAEQTIEAAEIEVPFTNDFGQQRFRKENHYTVSIPFVGDPVLFRLQPNTISSVCPQGEIRGNELLLEFQQRSPNAPELKRQIDEEIARIEKHLSWVRPMVDQYNGQLENVIGQTIGARKERLQTNISVLADVGIPIKQRSKIPSTINVPVRRKPLPLPQVSRTQVKRADPSLSNEVYDLIMRTMANMSLTIERNPTAFEHLSEEEIRFHFLVPLNALYEGGATAETFSYKGSTDIQIRQGGHPIFTAECKFWNGEKSLLGAVDQLLSYTTWRDTKTAILLFNKKKNFTQILEKLEPTMRKHPAFHSFKGKTQDTEFRFVVRHPEDEKRHINLAILAFNIPRK